MATKPNRNGLTWIEWIDATGETAELLPAARVAELVGAWLAGEDPTDYHV